VTVGWTIAFDHVARTMELLGSTPDLNELVRLQYSAALQLPTWAYSFGLGMFGAWLWVRLQPGATDGAGPAKRTRAIKATVIASAIGLAAVAWLIGGGYDDTRHSLALSLAFSTLVATLMVSLSLAPAGWQRPVAFNGIRRLGDISYGIYLSHMVIAYVLLDEFSLPVDGNVPSLLVWTVAVVPAAVLYGYLSARFVEQPIRRWARRFGRRGEPDSGGHTP
jgi:peptidoglycan/LPS O-acetylase OafA/YrhL